MLLDPDERRKSSQLSSCCSPSQRSSAARCSTANSKTSTSIKRSTSSSVAQSSSSASICSRAITMSNRPRPRRNSEQCRSTRLSATAIRPLDRSQYRHSRRTGLRCAHRSREIASHRGPSAQATCCSAHRLGLRGRGRTRRGRAVRPSMRATRRAGHGEAILHQAMRSCSSLYSAQLAHFADRTRNAGWLRTRCEPAFAYRTACPTLMRVQLQ